MKYIEILTKSNGRLAARFVLPLLCALSLGNRALGQNELDIVRTWAQFSDAPNATYHYLASQADVLLQKRHNELAGLKSLADWQRRQQYVRKTLATIMGTLPSKTPLNAAVLKTIAREGYTVENIVFQSQPGLYVTAALFVPAQAKQHGRLPAIIYCSGHSDDGYRHPVYQRVILNLVDKGFVVLAFDPLNQGERVEYLDASGKPVIGEADKEHSYSGALPFITGSSLAQYMLWDGIRAIDYLFTRPEVDTARIGITGRSGGGTQSAYIAAIDGRISAVAAENYITTFQRLIQSSGPQCAEQDPFNAIVRNIDIDDLLMVRAPKPALVLSTTRDLTFSIQGAREAAKEAALIYQAYGKKNNFGFVTDDAPHASTRKNREAMYAFFQKHLANPGDSVDHEMKLLTAEDLQVTPTGQALTAFHGATVFSINSAFAGKLNDRLVSRREKTTTHLPEAVSAARRLSGYRTPAAAEAPVFTGRFQKDGYVMEKYFCQGEGGYAIPYVLMKPEHPSGKAIIYLDTAGKAGSKPAEALVRRGFTVLAPDLLGTGEMGPGSFRGDSYIHGVSYNIWFLSMLIGRSIVGIQAADVVRLAHLLKQEGAREVSGYAFGCMAPVLLHAAAFDSSIHSVALVGSYLSYLTIAGTQMYKSDVVPSLVPAALTAYDLPDLAASLAPRRLLVADARDGAGNGLDAGAAGREWLFVTDTYRSRGAADHLKIGATADELATFYSE